MSKQEVMWTFPRRGRCYLCKQTEVQSLYPFKNPRTKRMVQLCEECNRRAHKAQEAKQ